MEERMVEIGHWRVKWNCSIDHDGKRDYWPYYWFEVTGKVPLTAVLRANRSEE